MTKKSQAPEKTLVAEVRAAIEACAGWNSRLAARRITQFLDKRMAPSGLSIAQFGLMAQIAAARDDTLGALALQDPDSINRRSRAICAAWSGTVSSRSPSWKGTCAGVPFGSPKKARQSSNLPLPVYRRAHAALAELVDLELARRLAHETQALTEE